MSHLLLVNYKAVLLATFISFLFGMAYYIPLGKQWVAAHSHDEAKLDKSPRPHIITALALFIIAFMFYGLLTHMPKFDIRNGLISAVLLWVGFFVAPFASNYAYNGKSCKAYGIDMVYWLGVLLINGTILGFMGKV
jgi:glucan phosphoethanolaminetransferase (alkaline phosphatase superfamily)